MVASILDVIVVGAGHAGLSISYHLKDLHLSHLVLEKGRIGDTWNNQRWDSFKLNTPNKIQKSSIFLRLILSAIRLPIITLMLNEM